MQKHFFFAITILCAIGFISIPVYAEETVQRYRDYSITDNGDGTKTNTFGLPQYVWNGSQFVDRIISNNGTHFNVYSEFGSFSFKKSTCSVTQYVKGFDPMVQVAHDSDIAIQDWYWTVARKNGGAWNVIDPTVFGCSISTSQNATGKYLDMTRAHPATGSYLKVTLAARQDHAVEDFNEYYMNVPAWSGQKFGFVLQMKNVKIDSILFRNGTMSQVPSGITAINKTQLTVDSFYFVKNGNAFYFDWKKALPNFNAVILNKTGSNVDAQFLFTANPATLTTGQKMFMDPTYGYSAATTDYSARTSAGAGAACAVASSKVLNDRQLQKSDTAAGGICIIDALQWDVSSIPSGSTVTNSSVQVQVSAVANGINCDLTQVTSDISTANVTALYSDIVNGTVYVSNNAFCASTGTKDIDLGASADTDITAQLTGDDLFGLGIKYNSMVRDASVHTMNWIAAGANGFQLRVTYVTVTQPPQALTCTGLPYGISCSWTVPNPPGGVTGYYLSTSLTNSSHSYANFTLTGNVTTGTIMGLGIGKLYYVQVNSTSSGAYNSSASHTTVTTDSKPTAPLNPYLTQNSTTFVKLNWQNVSSNGGDTVFGFRIDFCFDRCTAWLNWVNKTSTLNYNQTVPAYHVGKWRIGAWNGVGLSPYTANLTNGPDRITDLTTTYLQDTILGLDWSTPTLNGYTIIGYMINYTTPWSSNPATAIVNNTGNAATLYDVSGLTQGTQYTFRAAPLTTYTKNAAGITLNVTTTSFTPANFTIGFINFNSTNTSEPDIRFTRTDVNSTNTLLTIDYTPTLTLNCDLQYQFAQTNRTYSNLTSVIVDGDKQSSFQFLNGDNEIITIYCWDSATNTTGRYQLTQSDFELLNQIENFRNGTYGTMGLIGVLDLVTFAVILVSMIGFNRLNDAVGIIFSLIVVFVAVYFEIISDPVLIIPMLSLIALLAVVNTRKD